MKKTYTCLYLVLCFTSVLNGIDEHAVDCDFEENTCGWIELSPKGMHLECACRSTPSNCIRWYAYLTMYSPYLEKNMAWTRISSADLKNEISFLGYFPRNTTVMASSVKSIHELYIFLTLKIPNSQLMISFYLTSGELPISYSARCLHYTYLLIGYSELTVAYMPENGNMHKSLNELRKESEIILKRKHISYRFMKKTSVNLPVRPNSKLVFQSLFYKIGGNYAVLDDIFITNGVCPATAHCSDLEFRCLQSNDCIKKEQFCDGKPDCYDESDEELCEVLDFQKSSVLATCSNSTNMYNSFNDKKHRISKDVTGNGHLSNIDLNIPKRIERSFERHKRSIGSKLLTESKERKFVHTRNFSNILGSCNQKCPDSCLKSTFQKCISHTLDFHQFLEWQNVSCDQIFLHRFASVNVYSVNITRSRINSLYIKRKKMNTLQHITISNTYIKSLTVDQGAISHQQLQAINLINYTFQHVEISYSAQKSNFTIKLVSMNRQQLSNAGVNAVFSFQKDFSDISLHATIDNTVSLSLMKKNSTKYGTEIKFGLIAGHFRASLDMRLVSKAGMRFSEIYLNNNGSRSFQLYTAKYEGTNCDHYSMQRSALKHVYFPGINQEQLKLLDLSFNHILIINREDFSGTRSLISLKLHGNYIRSIGKEAFVNCELLSLLDLSTNSLTDISSQNFRGLKNLRYLFLSHNQISSIERSTFIYLEKLHTLDLSNNVIEIFEKGIFSELETLEKLYIQNNKIVSVEGMFAGLFSLNFLQVDFFSICCAKPRNYYDVTCIAPKNEISSCEQLISVPVLNVIIWYIAQLATFGNLIALIYNIINFSSGSSFTYYFLSCNLSLADLLMGVYLYIIAVVNLIHTGRYGFEDHKWRQSFLCTFEGVLATLSSEASVLFVFLITIDRVTAIKHPFSQRKKIWVLVAAGLSWIIAISLSVFPVLPLNFSLFDGFYSQSPICISLPLSVHRQPGWQYSMVIFIGFNFALFLGILFGHFIILFDVLKSGRVLRTSNTHVREITLAKSVVAVVMTDLLCWIPIGIIGMLTFSGIDVSREVYAWIIVLVLPINSAINPILYTLSGVLRDKRRRKVNENTFQMEKKMLEQEIVRLKRRLDSFKKCGSSIGSNSTLSSHG